MPYVELIATLLGVVLLAWIADVLTGRRTLPNMIAVAIVGGVAGAFLALRVFAVSEYNSWVWPMWSALGALVSLLVYFLFRNKR